MPFSDLHSPVGTTVTPLFSRIIQVMTEDVALPKVVTKIGFLLFEKEKRVNSVSRDTYLIYLAFRGNLHAPMHVHSHQSLAKLYY